MKRTERYEKRDKLGEGGMGVVYRAFDNSVGREVTLKYILNPQDRYHLDLFKRECDALARLAHPNIVEIYDVGETEEDGVSRPFLVMPLLRGETLESLIKSSSVRLTTERCIQIVCQVCRGLQAAHDQKLVHRDLKPSNIFLLEDDSVKIIDFGLAHLIDQNTATGFKGSVLYMAPEQIAMKQPTPLSDQFSVGVVCFEMLARQHPFKVPGYKDVPDAICRHSPAPISELNPAVSSAISQVVHKSLAKQSFHRFSDVREFSECLQKAQLNQFIPIFDPAKIEPRLERVRKAMADGDFDFADEVIRELQSESYLNSEIDQLRRQIEQIRLDKTIEQLLITANKRMEEQEYLPALQKVQEVLEIDPTNTQAFTLKAAIETKKSAVHGEGALRLAQQHLENRSYDLARQAAEKAIKLRPQDARAQNLLAEINRRESEDGRIRQEKDRVYQAAIQSFTQGDVSAALSKLERLLDLDRRSPESTKPEQSASYQALYEEVRAKRELLDKKYDESKRHVAEGDLTSAMAICEEVLKEYPKNVVFQALMFDIEEARREQISAYIAKVEKQVAAEPDFGRKVSVLEEATQRYPSEDRFRQSLDRFRARRDLVQSIVAKAAAFEDLGQFAEALGQWEIMRSTNPQYPGLDIEIERLKRRREQQRRAESKAQWVQQIDQTLGVNDFERAGTLARDALAEFENDPELLALEKSARLGVERGEEAQRTLAAGRDLLARGETEKGFAALRDTLRLDTSSQPARSALVEALLVRARGLLDTDWQGAEPLVDEALQLDPGNALGKSLRTLIRDNRESEDTTLALSKARDLQSNGDIHEAIDAVDAALVQYPGRDRLLQLRSVLIRSLPESERQHIRSKDLDALKSLAELSQKVEDPKQLDSILAQTRVYSAEYLEDNEFSQPLASIQEEVEKQGGNLHPGRATTALPRPVNGKTERNQTKWSSGASAALAGTADALRRSWNQRRGVFHSRWAMVIFFCPLLLGAVVFYLFRPKNFPIEPPASVAVVQATQTDLLEKPGGNGKHIMPLSRGTRLNVLRPVALDQPFTRVQFVSPAKNSPPGYVRRDDLGEWSDPQIAWELLEPLRPAAGAGESQRRRFAQQLHEFIIRYGGSDQGDKARLELAGIYTSLAEASKEAGKPKEVWIDDLNKAKEAFSGLRQPLSDDAARLQQRLAELETKELLPPPEIEAPSPAAKLVSKAIVLYDHDDQEGALRVADELERIGEKRKADAVREMVRKGNEGLQPAK